MSAGTVSPPLVASTELLSLENLRLSDGNEDVTPCPTSHQPNQQDSVWCSPRTVRQQPEVRLLLRKLARARTGGEGQHYGTPGRVVSKLRPFSAVKLSSAGSSSFDEHTCHKTRPTTSLGRSSGSLSVPSTRTSASSADTSFDSSGPFSVATSGSGSGKKQARVRRGRSTRSLGSFCNRVLSSTLVKGDEWAASKHRQMVFDPVMQKVTVHIMNFRNPAEEVTLSMSYSSSVTSHNSRVVTDDIQRLSGRKEHLTREKALKVEQRLAMQRRRRQNMAYARSMEMQRAAKGSDHDTHKTQSAQLSAPCLLACDRTNARQDRIHTRTSALTHTNTNTHTYLELNEDC